MGQCIAASRVVKEATRMRCYSLRGGEAARTNARVKLTNGSRVRTEMERPHSSRLGTFSPLCRLFQKSHDAAIIPTQFLHFISLFIQLPYRIFSCAPRAYERLTRDERMEILLSYGRHGASLVCVNRPGTISLKNAIAHECS